MLAGASYRDNCSLVVSNGIEVRILMALVQWCSSFLFSIIVCPITKVRLTAAQGSADSARVDLSISPCLTPASVGHPRQGKDSIKYMLRGILQYSALKIHRRRI